MSLHSHNDGHAPLSNPLTSPEKKQSDGFDHHDHSRPGSGSSSASGSGSGSPDRPPVSPLTPVASIAQLAPVANPTERIVPPQVSTFIEHPPSVPISESENPDAIALRSAISLLQLQREKSKRDLKTLEELKTLAVIEPEAFARDLRAKQRPLSKSSQDALAATLSDMTDFARHHQSDADNRGGDDRERRDSANTAFASIPQPQNIIRCPPVNWAKYHIVGDSLDKIHDEQGRRPSPSEPLRDHAVAAPYSPFVDRLGDLHPMQTRKGYKKPAN